MIIYAEIGTSSCTVDYREDASVPDGFVQMQSERPEPDCIAQADGTWILPVMPVDQAAKEKLAEINSTVDTLLQPITSTYPNTEIISWDKQEMEAKRWREWCDFDYTNAANIYTKPLPEPGTPLIDNILITQTDISKTELVSQIIKRVNAYAETGQIFGVRHNLEKELTNIVNDDTMTDDEKRAAIAAISVDQAYSAVSLKLINI